MSFIPSMFRGTPGVPTAPSVSSRPPSPQVSQTIDALVIGRIPTEHQPGVRLELRKILEDPQHRPYDQLIARATHPCVTEYLPQVLGMLESQKRSVA